MSKTNFSLHKRNLIVFLITALIVGADQLIKYLVDLYLRPVEVVGFIPKVLQFRYLENDGAMMGFMNGRTEIMTVLSIICFIVVAALLFMGKIKNKIDYVSFVLIISGGLGNIIDRLFRGYVIDYIEVLFVDFYVFNFADCLVTVGAFLLLGNQIYQIYKEQKAKKGEKTDG